MNKEEEDWVAEIRAPMNELCYGGGVLRLDGIALQVCMEIELMKMGMRLLKRINVLQHDHIMIAFLNSYPHNLQQTSQYPPNAFGFSWKATARS